MIDILKEIVNFIETSRAVGALIGCLFILIESIVPVLPLTF